MIHVRMMTADDAPLMMRCVQQAGWNQTRADCQRFVELEPEGCFVAERAGQPVGTTVACRFGPVGWVAMVLVDESVRRQGIGTRLVEHALSYLDRQQVPTMRLDATDLGRGLYERLGFTAEYEIVRYEGRAGTGSPFVTVTPFDRSNLAEVIQFDREASGMARGRLIERLLAEPTGAGRLVLEEGTLFGFVLRRAGRLAAQIGPAAAADSWTGGQLLDWALRRCRPGSAFVDIPSPNGEAVRWAASRGLKPRRHFVRMVRGTPVQDHPDRIWATAGPELA